MSPTLVEVIPPESPCATAAGAHAPALIVGLRWLYDTEQPATAVVDHRGRRLRSAGDRTVRFTPVGWQGRAMVLLIPTADAHGSRRPVSAGELDAFAETLRDLGEEVVATWTGQSRGLAALARPAHPSLRAAVRRYEAGCPEHDADPVCACGWLATGRDQVIGLTEVQQQIRAHAATLPLLPGPWPEALDPSGQCAQIAQRVARNAPLAIYPH